MAKVPIFSEGEAADVSYRNIRAAKNDCSKAGRVNCEHLWDVFEPHADPDFVTEIRSNFDARYWEMYLTVFLIRLGYEVFCPKPGPDVGIEVEGRKIWFEATSPTRGADGAADRVPPSQATAADEPLVFYDVPNEKLVLRYLNSISEKCLRQYPAWLKAGVVKEEDAFLVAINPRQLGHEISDTQPPRILQAAFEIGAPYVMLNAKTAEVTGSGYQFRRAIKKASGAEVQTGVFVQEEYAGLSALLCSRVDCVNRPEEMGGDFQLVPNPNARVPLPTDFRLRGKFFRTKPTEDGYVAEPE